MERIFFYGLINDTHLDICLISLLTEWFLTQAFLLGQSSLPLLEKVIWIGIFAVERL
jgi:hypothetical protein